VLWAEVVVGRRIAHAEPARLPDEVGQDAHCRIRLLGSQGAASGGAWPATPACRPTLHLRPGPAAVPATRPTPARTAIAPQRQHRRSARDDFAQIPTAAAPARAPGGLLPGEVGTTRLRRRLQPRRHREPRSAPTFRERRCRGRPEVSDERAPASTGGQSVPAATSG
jgi:hypothetical protein